MQALAQTRPSDLELTTWYGDTSDVSSKTIPDSGIFSELVSSIRQRSTLLALDDGTTKDAIYRSYAHDLELLQLYQREFEALVQAAVRHSIIRIGRNSQQNCLRPQETWEILKAQIPSGPATLLIDFPHTRAALPLPQLLEEIKTEFRSGTDQILRSLSDWLRVLVRNEFIGLVEWGDLDVCRYHYFKHEVTEGVMSDRTRNETSFDGSKPYGSRTEYRVVRDREIHRRQLRERHIHHIIHAKLHRLDEYQDRVPTNVAAFIDEIPVSLEPHVHILEGVITKEEVLRRQVAEERIVSSEILSVWKGSPGVLFDCFNMIGWSADDLKDGAVFYARQRSRARQIQRQRAAERRSRVVGRLFSA